MVNIRARTLESAKRAAKIRGLKVSSVKYNKTKDMKYGTDQLRIFSACKKKK